MNMVYPSMNLGLKILISDVLEFFIYQSYISFARLTPMYLIF